MIEAIEDIALVTERQVRDVEQGQAQAKAIAEGREVHPAALEASSATPPPAIDLALPSVQVQTIQRPPQPPPDPDTAMRHLRLSIVAVIVLVLFLFWLRQKKS